MKKVEIRNITKGNIIASQGILADNFFARLKGLIGRKRLDEGEALCINPCKSVHTFFMRFSIDIVFVDKNGVVCLIVNDLEPYKVSRYVASAKYVIELPNGKCKKSELEVGDKVDMITSI